MVTRSIQCIAAGRDHSLALMGNGEVLGWGAAGSGRADLPAICSVAPAATPVIVPATRMFTRISAGYGTGYGITADNKAYAWGFNRGGIGGRADVVGTLQAEPIQGISQVAQLAVAEFFGVALYTDGAVVGWGLTRGGPRNARNTAPLPIPLTSAARHVAVGGGHVLVLTEDGLVAWGANAAGQLGQGHLQDQATPGQVRFPNAMATLQTAAAGASHNLALDADGQVWAWGSNQHGQLGRQQPSYSTLPLPVALPEAATQIAAGMFFSVALGASGKVYTWGWNAKGQLGRSPHYQDAQPGTIDTLAGIEQIAVGQAHVLAASGASLYAWGDNASNQLGPNGQPNRGPEHPGWSPVPVAVLA